MKSAQSGKLRLWTWEENAHRLIAICKGQRELLAAITPDRGRMINTHLRRRHLQSQFNANKQHAPIKCGIIVYLTEFKITCAGYFAAEMRVTSGPKTIPTIWMTSTNETEQASQASIVWIITTVVGKYYWTPLAIFLQWTPNKVL